MIEIAILRATVGAPAAYSVQDTDRFGTHQHVCLIASSAATAGWQIGESGPGPRSRRVGACRVVLFCHPSGQSRHRAVQSWNGCPMCPGDHLLV